MTPEVLADHTLSVRLERAEGRTNAHFVEARARLMPESRAKWISVAGAMAMFDGVNSPCTQTFGLGLTQMPSAEDLLAIENFFRARGAAIVHEVSPLGDKALLPMLSDRGYRPVEMSNVMFLPLAARTAGADARNGAVLVRQIREDERELWARTSAEGWSQMPEFADLIFDMGRVVAGAGGNTSFLAELDGQAVAAGSLAIHDGVAIFAGASTVPAWRQRGAQQALLQTRFEHALEKGCDLAMMVAEPGSSSQRNAERQGFRIAYTRTKWMLAK